MVCAEAVGIMDKTLSMTAEYLNTRKQFGVPISSFQALRHRLADMKMQLELARSMSYYATLKVGSPAQERRQAMARAVPTLHHSGRRPTCGRMHTVSTASSHRVSRPSRLSRVVVGLTGPAPCQPPRRRTRSPGCPGNDASGRAPGHS